MSSVLVKQLQLELRNLLYDYSVRSKMIRASLLALFSTMILCYAIFSTIVFVVRNLAISLAVHTWRCKNKLDFNQTTKQNEVPTVEICCQECLPASSYKAV